jgi:RNA polymerase sigma factor (sigma-70 family)
VTNIKRLFENCLFYPISVLSEEFNPQNIRYIPPVKFFFRLELEQTKQFSNSLLEETGKLFLKPVYDHCDFLRRLTQKRYKDAVLADEAYSYAFEGLAQNDWRRVRAYQGKSSFQRYLGSVWCRLLEDFSIKKFGKMTPPTWIRNLGGVWRELFKLLCCRYLSVTESVEKIMGGGRYAWNVEELEIAANEILAKIPHCGQKKGPVLSLDEKKGAGLTNSFFKNEKSVPPEKVIIQKERWIALQALAGFFFKESDQADSWNEADSQKLNTLIVEIRKRLPLTNEEQLILTTHFVDGVSITDVGKRLRLNQNQIHGKFRRLMNRIKRTLPKILAPYL